MCAYALSIPVRQQMCFLPLPVLEGKREEETKVVIIVSSTAGRVSDRPHAFKDLCQKKVLCFSGYQSNCFYHNTPQKLKKLSVPGLRAELI